MSTASDPAVLRILVVDADDRTRESIVGILGIRQRFEVVGSAAHIGDAIALVRTARPDLVILDPRLPEVSGGLTLIRRIHAIDPGIRILAVGWSPDLEHQAITAGADCFVRKTFKPGDLAAAVARCMASRDPGAAGVDGDGVADRAEALVGRTGPPDAGTAVGQPTAGTAVGQPTNPSPGSVSTRGAGLIL